jgi:hypothetical protein
MIDSFGYVVNIANFAVSYPNSNSVAMDLTMLKTSEQNIDDIKTLTFIFALVTAEPSESNIIVFTSELRCDDDGISTIGDAKGSIHKPKLTLNPAWTPAAILRESNAPSNPTESTQPIPGTSDPFLTSQPRPSNSQLHSSASSATEGHPL